jgi:ABC-type polysaccharide/polyol phosphate transport system ATPase subunit
LRQSTQFWVYKRNFIAPIYKLPASLTKKNRQKNNTKNMKLIKARVQNYRSIRDTGEFEIEELKTIMVGPNEAGKTVILQALQKLIDQKA